MRQIVLDRPGPVALTLDRPAPESIALNRPGPVSIVLQLVGDRPAAGVPAGSSITAAQTIAPVIQSAHGAAVARASAVQVAGGVSQSATGSPVGVGQAAQSVAGVSQAATGAAVKMASGAQTTATLSQSAQGAAVAFGAASQVAAAMTQTAASSSVARGAATQTVAAVSQSAGGSPVAKGSAAQVVATITQSASGGSGDPLRGGWDTAAFDAPVMAFSNNNRTVIGHDPTGGAHNTVLSLASLSSGKGFASVSFDVHEYGGIAVTDSPDSNFVYFAYDGEIYSSAEGTIEYIDGFQAPGIVDASFNVDENKVWFRVDGGNWNGDPGADPETGIGGYYLPASALPYHIKVNPVFYSDSQRTLNTGTAAFTYPPPVGFTPLRV